MIKAVFFDIDGTLVSFKTHRVPESTVKSLKALQNNGVKIFIASGRHPSVMDNVREIPFDGYVALNGGAAFVGGEAVYERFIPQEDVDALARYLEAVHAFPCTFIYQKGHVLNFKNQDVDEVFKIIDFPDFPCWPLEAIRREKIYQVLAFFKGEEEAAVMQRLPGCSTTRWSPLFTDIIPKGGSKWIGIEKVLEHFGIAPDETMAFGDGGNDVEMLRNAGIGVAMQNAEMGVQQAADYVTTSVDDDGIANALRHFRLI